MACPTGCSPGGPLGRQLTFPIGDAKIGRPGRDRAKVLSVRLNAKEYERLTAQAELAGVGPSTLARSMILGALNPSEGHAPIDNWVTSVSGPRAGTGPHPHNAATGATLPMIVRSFARAQRGQMASRPTSTSAAVDV